MEQNPTNLVELLEKKSKAKQNKTKLQSASYGENILKS